MTRYVMDRQAPNESERLSLLEMWADSGTTQCLDAIGVRPGSVCLEVGAGAGSIARWLCERVGINGRVVATDLDCSLLDAHDLPNLEVRRHDIVSDELPEGTFDLVHARMVLEHLPERAQVLSKLTASLKPGGSLVLEDQDIVSVAPASKRSAGMNSQFMLRSLALVRLLTAAGVDLEYGRSLYNDLRSENLVDVCAEGRVSIVAGGSTLAKFWRLTWEQLRPQLIGSRLLSEWDVAEFIELLDDPEFVWMSPTIMAAWGRRPTA